MEHERTYYHVQEPRIVIGDTTFGEGDYFWSDEVDRPQAELDELTGRGFISPVKVVVEEDELEEPAEDDESDEADEEEPVDDLAVLTRGTLLERLEEEGVTEDQIPGTGKGGYVTKDDALATARTVLE